MPHTPGPWRATKLGASVLAGKTTIAHIEHVGLDETRMANALVTAAAPNLLAACKAVKKDQQAGRFLSKETLDLIYDAIEKAKDA